MLKQSAVSLAAAHSYELQHERERTMTQKRKKEKLKKSGQTDLAFLFCSYCIMFLQSLVNKTINIFKKLNFLGLVISHCIVCCICSI